MKFAADRMNNLPPYLFAEIDRAKERLEAEGHDVISLGIGDPDKPTPQRIIDVMLKAVQDPKNHQYPSYFGSPEYRKACAQYMKKRFNVDLDYTSEVLALIGSKDLQVPAKENLAAIETALKKLFHSFWNFSSFIE